MSRLIASVLINSILLRPAGRVADGGGGSNALLLEDGFYLLLETADKLLLE